MENINHHHECDCGVCKHSSKKRSGAACGGGPAGGIYGMAFIGALVYYIQHATTFWSGVLGVLKAIIWPAMLVYKLLGYLGM